METDPRHVAHDDLLDYFDLLGRGDFEGRIESAGRIEPLVAKHAPDLLFLAFARISETLALQLAEVTGATPRQVFGRLRESLSIQNWDEDI